MKDMFWKIHDKSGKEWYFCKINLNNFRIFYISNLHCTNAKSGRVATSGECE